MSEIDTDSIEVDEEGWTPWVFRSRLAEQLGYSAAASIDPSAGHDWLEVRPLTEHEERLLRSSVKELVRAHVEKWLEWREGLTKGRDKFFSFDVLERWRLYTAAEVAETVGCTKQTVYIAAKDGRLDSIPSHGHAHLYGLPPLAQKWQPIEELADLLGISRKVLDRRLTQFDTINCIQWAHYQRRESQSEGRAQYEARIAPGYTPAPLTREQVAALIRGDEWPD